MSTTVHVKGISSQTSEKEVRDFFSFCGKISSLTVDPSSDGADATKTASVTFEKETAAKTALLLDNTKLGTSQVEVSSASSTGPSATGGKAADDDEDVPAEEKPRTRILAEYLAHGYVISDKAIQNAIDLDSKHGISSRFQKALTDFDSKYKVSDKAQAADNTYKVSERANQAWSGFYSYFDKALDTPTGQRVRNFYTQGNKQVLDVHNEARHLADLKAGKFTPHKTADGSRTECKCSADAGKCGCAPGTCACSSCAKNPETPHKGAEEMGLEKVGGSERTKCNCGANAGTCACEPGTCACSSCAKNPEAEKPTLPPTAPAGTA